MNTSYDAAGHVRKVDDQTDVEYWYDVLGRVTARRQTNPDGTQRTTLYFYWGTTSTLAEETDRDGDTIRHYVSDDRGRPVAQDSYHTNSSGEVDVAPTAAVWAWLMDDPHGNRATVLRSSDGVVIDQASYKPYGGKEPTGSKQLTDDGVDPHEPTTVLGFQAALSDEVTGKVLLGPRQYDPATARFTTPDTYTDLALDLELALDPLTGNRYLFAAANPLAYHDDGHRPTACDGGYCPQDRGLRKTRDGRWRWEQIQPPSEQQADNDRGFAGFVRRNAKTIKTTTYVFAGGACLYVTFGTCALFAGVGFGVRAITNRMAGVNVLAR